MRGSSGRVRSPKRTPSRLSAYSGGRSRSCCSRQMLSLSARWQRSAAQRKGRGSTVGTDAQRDFATSAVQRTCKRPHALHVGDLATLVIEERIVADLGEVRGQGQHDILILGAEPVDQAQVNHRMILLVPLTELPSGTFRAAHPPPPLPIPLRGRPTSWAPRRTRGHIYSSSP